MMVVVVIGDVQAWIGIGAMLPWTCLVPDRYVP